jgi:hypothetical protein
MEELGVPPNAMRTHQVHLRAVAKTPHRDVIPKDGGMFTAAKWKQIAREAASHLG